MILHVGDSLTVLRSMPDESAHCCVTSPPYFCLRNYGIEGQLGLEETPAFYIERMVEVFREVRRALRPDGTAWINIGDSYAGAAHGARNRWPKQSRNDHAPNLAKRAEGIKTKDLIGIPWMLAFALRADGWYLRQEIIWEKANPMPESVRDRPSRNHEQIFLLTKRPTYYYDAKSIMETCSSNTHARMARSPDAAGSRRANGGSRPDRPMHAVVSKQDGHGKRYAGFNERWKVKNNASFAAATAGHVFKRNKRTVWTVSTQPYKGAHFATFPPKLIEPCILAGAPRGGVVLDPFAGTGTTGYVAAAHGREFVGIELNPAYAELAKRRVPGLILQTEGVNECRS